MANFGDVPEWVAAIGTVAAFGGSLFLLRGQLYEWRRNAEDRRRNQAENVTAWVWNWDSAATPNPLLTIRVSNNNGSAVSAVTFQINVGNSGTYWRWLGSLGPMEIREVDIPLSGTPRSNLLEPDLAFTDSAGRRWIRRSGGELRPWTPADRFESKPGAYRSIAEHPTLSIDPGDEGRRIRP